MFNTACSVGSMVPNDRRKQKPQFPCSDPVKTLLAHGSEADEISVDKDQLKKVF